MKAFYLALLLATLAGAQQHKLRIDPSTEEGALLRQISQAAPGADRQALLEQFVLKYPKNRALPWVCGQLQALYLQQHEYNKAIQAGERAFAIDPDDIDVDYQTLKAAEGAKDPELVKRWSDRTSALARRMIDTERSEESVAHAREVDLYTEYALYATALQETNPASIVALVSTLETQNPQSQYLPKLWGRYLSALKQMGQVDRAVARGEELARSSNPSEDVLLFLADYYFQKKSDPGKTLQFSNTLADVLNRKPKPPGLSDEDWRRRKESLWGLAYAMSGITFSTQGLYREADQTLRWALQYLQDGQLRTACLFHLGQSDFNLGKVSKDKDQLGAALDFSEQAAAIDGPFQQLALRNIKLIKAALAAK